MAVHFDGTGDCLYVYNATPWYKIQPPLTISLWVCMDVITDYRVLYTTGPSGWGCRQLGQ